MDVVEKTYDTKGEKRFLVDPYLEWCEGEGIPIHLDFGHDLHALETKPWARYDARGCFAHTHGRGDFMACYVLEVPKGSKTRPVKHLYETHFFVLSGNGSTVCWMPDGEKRTFEWGPNSLFSIPINSQYQFFNASGSESARMSCVNDAPLTINLYHNVDFVFNNPYQFVERTGAKRLFDGEGDHLELERKFGGKGMFNIWETNFVPDLTGFKLFDLESRGKGSRNIFFLLADGTQHAHMSEIPVGRYKKAHRHAAGTHVHAVTGHGYSLLWYDGDSEFVEIPWRHGIMYTPPFWMFHQHFNTSEVPARYLACSLGSARYPFLSLRRRSNEGGGTTSVKQGGRQIEYEDQDPRIHRKFLDAIKKTGIKSLMGDLFDEPAILALPKEKLTGVIQNPQSIGPAI
jgi:mannose-6-phosphate isomerase-like protein (cupin superfamily)